METKLKAKEILDYCILELTGNFKIKDKKKYKEMLKEIIFMLETD